MAKIGVAISGGGYRASAWGLGVLWYLADAGVNGDVTQISSVSGGSLTNAHAGWLPKPYTAVTADEYRDAARSYGKRLAGRLGVWTPMLLVTLLATVLGCWGVVIGNHCLVWAGVVLGLLAGIWGTLRCGDLLFNQWWVWAWIDGLAVLVGVLFWWRHHWWLWLDVLAIGVYLMTRGPVVGICMGASLKRLTKRSDTSLGGLNATPLHVILSTELHSGREIGFSRLFVYNFDVGVGAKPSLPVHTAVQASSNLPGAFPTRWLATSGMNLVGGKEKASYLALTDGGVYDNMGDQWFMGFTNRMGNWAKDPALASVLAQVQPLKSDFVIVANASAPPGWTKRGTGAIPLLGELIGLLAVKSVLYTVGTTTRRSWDITRFDKKDPDGTLVHIATEPTVFPTLMLASADPLTKQRAQESLDWIASLGVTDWKARMDAARSAGTQLWPLGEAVLRNVVNTAYVQAAANLHVRLGTPFSPPPYPL
jgi:predicted acylesterase/phospholipase RssA